VTPTPPSPADRRARAQAQVALSTLDGHLSDHRRPEVRCRRSHRVAAVVYDVDGYLVYRSTVGSRAHGRRDRIDVGHAGDQRGRCYADLLDGAVEIPVDDGLPASCGSLSGRRAARRSRPAGAGFAEPTRVRP
jgi:hypothetical protein